MISSEIASRYSKALFELAKTSNQLEETSKNLEEVLHVVETLELNSFFTDPSVSSQQKKDVLKQALEKHIHPLVLTFLQFLIDKRRFNFLSEISSKYTDLVKKNSEILEVELTTAIPADDKMKKALTEKLEKLYRKKIKIKEKLDEEILGGVILLVGNQMIDDSIKHHLLKLKENLLLTNVSNSTTSRSLRLTDFI